MSSNIIVSEDQLNLLRSNPRAFLDMSTEELFAIDWDVLEPLQLELAQRQFEKLRPSTTLAEV